MYLRQSQDRSGEQLGIDRQREDVHRLVAARGWTVVAEYVDNDVSATSRKPRPAFNRMMEAVDAGDVDVIAARHIDRLLRKLSEMEQTLERCDAHGVYIVTASDSVDTSTDGGRLVARILASVGQGEMERKSARQKAAQAQAAKLGRWTGGRRAFGYESDGVTICESEAELIRQGYADVLAGLSMGEVARKWNAAGLRTPQGQRDGTEKLWNHQNAKDVLTNPRYAGLRRHREQGQRASIRQNPTLGIVATAEWPALVSEDTWRATVAALTDPARWKPVKGRKKLLTGVAMCAECLDTVHGGASSHGKPAYRCRSLKHVSRLSDPIDEFVSAVAVERLSRPDALATFAPQVEQDTRPMSEEADTLRKRLDDVAVTYADGAITDAQFRTVTTRVRERLAEIEAEIAAAGSADLIAPLLRSDDVRATWEALETGRKRSIIEALMEVTIHPVGRGVRTFKPESVGIEWKEIHADQ
ncbi:recombinase family protein [Rhodococcus hoagii]|nr:recombinase family protein [Prescottella equi]